MKVRDVMTRFPATCTPDTPIRAAANLMISADCGGIPVVGAADDFPIGMITDRDIAVRAVARGLDPETPVGECMTMAAITLTEDDDLDECIELLERRQVRRAIVVDRTGRCTGIVAQADVATHASKRKTGELLQVVSQPIPDPPVVPLSTRG